MNITTPNNLRGMSVQSRHLTRITFLRNLTTQPQTLFSSGPQGVDGRTPHHHTKPHHTQLTVTDPFVLYKSYISQGLLEKDEHQLRAMKEFQKLYHRVISYKPPEDLQIKISLLLRKIEIKHSKRLLKESKGRILPIKLGHLASLFQRDPEIEKRQLVKFITDEEELCNYQSPQGLLVNGEVGCGKSMLMDIFASSLPHDSKMRWHFNNFILWVYNEIHKIQNEKILTSTMSNTSQRLSMENEFILFEIAQKMINKNTILMLDEFMLPDIASANIIKILFTYYFKLGGVLVATSNKLPEELYSNDFHKSKFKTFVNILNYRCKSIEMRSSRDFRLELSSMNSEHLHQVVKFNNDHHEAEWNQLIKYHLLGVDKESDLMDPKIKLADARFGGKQSQLKVYNRITPLPLTFNESIAYLDFDYICRGLFGSSDYITLASTYKTIILTNVPILTTKMKNEARRFITLLDALYESKCQFYLKCEVPIEHMFFPDSMDSTAPQEIKDLASKSDNNNLEVQDEEMFAKTSIALSKPYRPNVSTYDQNHTSEYKEDVSTAQNDYKDLKAFTGEDEKFAYKRAVSRIQEMTGSLKWRQQDRWVPIDHSMRPWESVKKGYLSYDRPTVALDEQAEKELDKLINDRDALVKVLPRDLSASYNLPFRQFNKKFAPIFSNIQHFWTMGSWNPNIKGIKDDIARSWVSSSRK